MTTVPTYAPSAVAPTHDAPAVPAPRHQSAPAAAYTVSLARDEDDVRAAQRLRHQVFAAELGADLHSPVTGLDIDPFDEHCDHLLVREGEGGTVLGP